MSESPLLVIDTWSDEPEDGRTAEDWPYPTCYTRSIAQGELADRIRRALNVADDIPVYVVEEYVSDGYSEYTQEDYCYMKITAGNEKHVIDGSWEGGLPALLDWLDAAAPVLP